MNEKEDKNKKKLFVQEKEFLRNQNEKKRMV